MHFDVCTNYKDYINIKESLDENYKEKLLEKVKYYILALFTIVEEIYNNNDRFFIIYTFENKKTKSIRKTNKVENKILKIIKINSKENKKYNKTNSFYNKSKCFFSNRLLKDLNNSVKDEIKKIIEENENDKSIYRDEIFNITNQVLFKINNQFQNENIYVLLKEYKSKYNDLLIKLASNYKVLNIITFNVKCFKDIEEKILEKYENQIVVSNNKLKALKKAKYIINMDFNEKDINTFNINREAIIFNISDNRLDNIKGFNGKLINNIELNDKFDNNKKYYLYSRFKNYNYNIYKKIEIKKIKGKNGYIYLHN